jgi:hypothetical protein
MAIFPLLASPLLFATAADELAAELVLEDAPAEPVGSPESVLELVGVDDVRVTTVVTADCDELEVGVTVTTVDGVDIELVVDDGVELVLGIEDVDGVLEGMVLVGMLEVVGGKLVVGG